MCIIMRTVRIGDIKCILAIDTKTPHAARSKHHTCMYHIIYVALSSTRTNTNSTMKLCMHGGGGLYTKLSVTNIFQGVQSHTRLSFHGRVEYTRLQFQRTVQRWRGNICADIAESGTLKYRIMDIIIIIIHWHRIMIRFDSGIPWYWCFQTYIDIDALPTFSSTI